MTQAAVIRYQENRELPQTGSVDSELLQRLRQDPAPQVAQRPARPASRTVRTRSSDPFEPLQTAARRFERWVQSLGR
jgi:peptidoglycan hydrolase-like protein with peptidoglycan-binding domain